MPVIINGSTGVDTPAVTADSSGNLNLQSGGVTRAVVSSSGLKINRVDSSNEGGQLDLCRSSDNTSAWAIDVYGNTSTPSLRFVDNVAAAARLQIDGTGIMTVGSNTVMGITRGTTVASTSGTSIDFTGIPSWVKRITLMFNSLSTNGSSFYQIQLGTSGGIKNSGYVGGSGYSTTQTNNSAGFLFRTSVAAGTSTSGHSIITNSGSNLWIQSSVMGAVSDYMTMGGGAVTLSDTLTTVRITTVNGTDTFDAGSINILYE